MRNTNLVIVKASQLVEALNSASPEDSSTVKYSFRVVEEFPPMTRIPSIQRQGIKLHSFSVVNGGLKSRAVSCLECLETSLVCQGCSDAAHTVSPERVKLLLGHRSAEDVLESTDD